MKRVWPLRTLLALQLGALTLGPLLLVAGLTLLLLRPQIDEETRSHQQVVAELVASQVEGVLTTGANELHLMSTLLANSTLDHVQSQTLLDQFVEQNTVYEVVYLSQRNGIVTQVGLPPSSRAVRANFLGIDMSRKAFFRTAEQSNAGEWSETFLSAVSGKLSVAFSVATGDGVLIGEIAIDHLPQLLQRASSDKSLTIMILDSVGQLLAHPDETLSGQQLNLSNLPLVAERKSSQVLTGNYHFAQQDWVGSVVTMRQPTWSVMVSQPLGVVRGLGDMATLILGACLVVGLLAALLAALLSSGSLSRRFAVYANIIRGFATGHYEFARPTSAVAEFTQLSDDLVHTADAIRTREADLAKINTDLEGNVARRTHELSRANSELQAALRNLTRAQSELVQSEKLAALGALVAGIAHELNTPIGVGVTAVTSLADQTKQFTEEFQQGSLTKAGLETFLDDIRWGNDVVQRNLIRAAELIASFKQVAVDQTSSQRRYFSLAQTVNEVLITMRPITKRTPFEIDVDIPERIHLDSYPGPLGQIITNLVLNSIKHGLEGRDAGTIRISASMPDDNAVELRVEDDGVGIAPENLGRVFDPFFTTKLGKGGSGLGLNIVHNMTTNVLKGRVQVESELGKGTCIRLRFPINPA